MEKAYEYNKNKEGWPMKFFIKRNSQFIEWVAWEQVYIRTSYDTMYKTARHKEIVEMKIIWIIE